MKKKISLLLFTLFSWAFAFAEGGAPGTGYGPPKPPVSGGGGAPGTGYGPPKPPSAVIDNNLIILISVAILLVLMVLYYKKLYLKRTLN